MRLCAPLRTISSAPITVRSARRSRDRLRRARRGDDDAGRAAAWAIAASLRNDVRQGTTRRRPLHATMRREQDATSATCSAAAPCIPARQCELVGNRRDAIARAPRWAQAGLRAWPCGPLLPSRRVSAAVACRSGLKGLTVAGAAAEFASRADARGTAFPFHPPRRSRGGHLLRRLYTARGTLTASGDRPADCRVMRATLRDCRALALGALRCSSLGYGLRAGRSPGSSPRPTSRR